MCDLNIFRSGLVLCLELLFRHRHAQDSLCGVHEKDLAFEAIWLLGRHMVVSDAHLSSSQYPTLAPSLTFVPLPPHPASLLQVLVALKDGSLNRKTCATKMNSSSSRSHALLSIRMSPPQVSASNQQPLTTAPHPIPYKIPWRVMESSRRTSFTRCGCAAGAVVFRPAGRLHAVQPPPPGGPGGQ
jgi:hypothetical protein